MNRLVRVVMEMRDTFERRLARWAKGLIFSPSASYLSFGAGQTVGASTWDETDAIEEGMDWSVWVAACCTAIADAVASLPWKVYRRTMDRQGWVEFSGHPLAQLLEHPNDAQGWSAFMERLVLYLMLTGNAPIYKMFLPESKQLGALWIIRPDYIKPVPGKTGSGVWVSEWKLSSGAASAAGMRSLPSDAVLNIMLVDPTSEYWGRGPTRNALQSIDLDDKSHQWNVSAMDNRVAPSGMIVPKRTLTADQHADFMTKLAAAHQTSANARKPMVASEPMDLLQWGMTAEDMDFLNQRKLNREEICAAYRVPPPVVGIQDASTFNNVSEANRRFYLNCVLPLAHKIADALTHALCPLYLGGEDLAIDFDTTGLDAMSQTLLERASAAQTYWSMGVPFKHINEALGLGLPRFSGDDVSWMNAGLMPADAMTTEGTSPTVTASRKVPMPIKGKALDIGAQEAIRQAEEEWDAIWSRAPGNGKGNGHPHAS